MKKKKKSLDLHIKKGALHAALGVPQGEKIPSSMLADKPGDSALMRKRKNLARVMRNWHH